MFRACPLTREGKVLRVLLTLNFNFDVATGHSGVKGFKYTAKMKPKYWPLRVTKDDKGNFTASQVLLIVHVFICRNQHFKPSFFGRVQQIAIGEA